MRPIDFRRFLENNYEYMIKFARSRHWADPEDCVHNAIAAVGRGSWRKFRRTGEAKIRTWFTQALIYVWLAYVRHQRLVAFTPLTGDLTAESPFEAIDFKVDLEKRLCRIPARARDAFILLVIEGHTTRETGARLGIDERSVRRDLTAHVAPILDELRREYLSN